MSRLTRFVEHYKIIRKNRKRLPFFRFLLSQFPLGAYHPSYSMWNCAYWAWKNSGTHHPDGSYL